MSEKTTQERAEGWLIEVQDHLRDELLPFWRERGSDEVYGGFLTYFDKDGLSAAGSEKTLLCQAQMIYSFCSIEREGFATGEFLDRARRGIDFLLDHFWDDTHGGWYWATDQQGTPIDETKSLYAQAFAILALSEYGMVSGDYRGAEWATNTFQTIQTFCADNRHGGYFDLFRRDWTRARDGGTKSFAAHLRLMQGLSNLFESTGATLYRDKSLELLDVIRSRLIHPQHGTSILRTRSDWQKGDVDPPHDPWTVYRLATHSIFDGLSGTRSGLNAEYTCHLNQTLRLVGVDPQLYKQELRKIYTHIADHTIDSLGGGVVTQHSHDGSTPLGSEKVYWEQGECMIALLDAYLMFEESRYLDRYENIHRFVMDHMIAHAVGEWYSALNEDNTVIHEEMAGKWKTCYSTVRAMIQCESRLLKLAR